MYRYNWTFFFVIALIIHCDAHSIKRRDVLKSAPIYLPLKGRSVQEEKGKVVGIKDGDTFELLIAGRQQVVRLAHIDCPEKKQPFGAKAKLFASRLCFGKQVSIIHYGKYDRSKRLIAEIILDGHNMNKELVLAGLAWHFKKYSSDREYARLEKIARDQRKGLWYEKDPVAPWQWRRTKHASAITYPAN